MTSHDAMPFMAPALSVALESNDKIDSALDLFTSIGGWNAELAEIAASFNLPAVSDLCADVDEECRRSSFRVVVVGEFNRGKSTVVNQLLGLDVMPTGPLALTKGLVFARGSESARMEVESSGGHRRRLPLSLDSWTAVGPGDRVTVWVDAAWLRDGSIELVDTAGINSAAPDHLSAARRAVRRSDAAILCVSAEQPLAETERQFLAGEVLRRQVPHVIAVLTMADRIDEDDRAEVIERLHTHLADLGDLKLVVSPGVDPGAAVQLRELVTEMAARPGRAVARARTLASVLLDAAELCEAAAETGRVLRRQDSIEQSRVVDALSQNPPGTDSQWEQLLAEFGAHARELLSSLHEELSKDCDYLVDRYVAELRTAHDPLAWWSEMLDTRAAGDVKRQATQCAASLRAAVERDAAWLEREAARRFGFRAAAPRVPFAPLSADFERPTVSLTDTAGRRRRARVAGNAGALLASAVAIITRSKKTGVFSATGGLVGNLTGEKILRALNAHNVSEARPLLTAALDASFEQLANKLSTLVPSLYQNVGMSLRDMARAEHNSRLRAAETEMTVRAHSAPDWDHLAETAVRVATEIHVALRSL
jgi:GTPase SAR1 family protein